MKISVIIPAYNEEKRIEKAIHTVSSYMEENFDDYEIIIVDDGSTDRTKEKAIAAASSNVLVLSYDKNRGKGGAVKHGVLSSTGDIIVFTDADLPYPVYNIKNSYDILKNKSCDYVLGIRKKAEGEKGYPLIRKIMSFTFSKMVHLILGLNVPDTQCGFKAFSRKCALDVFSKTQVFGWGFDVEAIFIAQKYGYTYKRLEVLLHHDNKNSKISVLKDPSKMISELKLIKKNNEDGKYD